MKLDERLANIVSEVFEVPVEELSIDTNRDDIDAWDSLGHLNLIMSVEKAFKVKFKTEEVETIESLRDLQEKLIKLGIL